MSAAVSLVAVAVLFLLGFLGAAGTVPEAIFGVAIPYLALAVFLEAWPVNAIFMSSFAGIEIHATRWVLAVSALALAVVLSLAVCVIPMQMGVRHLEARES